MFKFSVACFQSKFNTFCHAFITIFSATKMRHCSNFAKDVKNLSITSVADFFFASSKAKPGYRLFNSTYGTLLEVRGQS